MQGLRQQENPKFEKYFEMVQKEASKKGCVFFLDCGLGNIHENDKIECEDLTGWLIERKKVPEFEQLFSTDSELHNFDEAYCSAIYRIDDSGSINVDIVSE